MYLMITQLFVFVSSPAEINSQGWGPCRTVSGIQEMINEIKGRAPDSDMTAGASAKAMVVWTRVVMEAMRKGRICSQVLRDMERRV